MDARWSRARMIRHLRDEIADQRVLAAMSRVPREFFVPPESHHLAYADMPLPIAQGQTISQPYMVALMTQALQLTGRECVLEVGTGSGYQAAVLGEMTRRVVSVERHSLLATRAQLLLERLGYHNVEVHLAGDELGWPVGAPYDAIVVTAGAPAVPQALLDQLVDGGRLIIPVGSRHSQHLLRITRDGDRVARENLGACLFVPLVGRQAWQEADG